MGTVMFLIVVKDMDYSWMKSKKERKSTHEVLKIEAPIKSVKVTAY